MTAHPSDLIGPLYHGTRAQAAKAILRDGFRRGRSRSYTGTGICLSESISVAYEYGMYETGGSILQAWLSPTARLADRSGCMPLECAAGRDTWDDYFATSGLDAVRAYGGNVWVVWSPQVLIHVSRLSHREAVRRLCAEFDADGPDCGYNGVVSDYASIWWEQSAENPNLVRFPDHRNELERTLKRFVGRTHSQQLPTQTVAAQHTR
jgi:hypothetical protein